MTLSSLSLAAGLLVCALAWFAPQVAWPWSFADHMARHIAVVAVAAPLVAVALADSRGARRVSPMLAVIVEFVAVWGWHVPAAHVAAQTSPLWFALEQASYLGSGVLVWVAVLRPTLSLGGPVGLLLTSMHMTLLGALLMVGSRAIYPSEICGGAADQQVGGMIMLAVGTPIYLIAGLVLVARTLLADTPRKVARS
ncbi:cytochrome c oxidase assembly protein [Thalassobaculum sp. OXR-137]|uniref:cytochrome c oxidase assembly protein n=1 Tax=Thalassobaculum sp. OXR-137 TaxID=3100173 RepID=UPI002AC8C620|nr:cytochrome c oxidase assembly protein [Thalassobaculum sp. OXR-137]WPZ34405.1 cytochrome c oxidase assembly protein [Thalassobaculum sp. OXR-137]